MIRLRRVLILFAVGSTVAVLPACRGPDRDRDLELAPGRVAVVRMERKGYVDESCGGGV